MASLRSVWRRFSDEDVWGELSPTEWKSPYTIASSLARTQELPGGVLGIDGLAAVYLLDLFVQDHRAAKRDRLPGDIPPREGDISPVYAGVEYRRLEGKESAPGGG